MGKILEVRKLYKEVINDITQSEEKWIKFLESSSWQFKYDFIDKVLIYAQNPNAKACAEMQVWNEKIRPKRWVNKNANCIFVISKDENSEYPFRLVFDVADTHNYIGTDYRLWNVKPEYEQEIIETLDTTYNADNESNDLKSAIISNSYNLVLDNVQDYFYKIKEFKNNSLLNSYEESDLYNGFVSIVWTSVAYMMLQRCGIEARELIGQQEFSFVKNFDNEDLITILGSAVSDIAESGIREIYKTVKNLQIEEKNKNHTFVKNQNMIYSNNIEKQKGGTQNGENRIYKSERLQYTKSSDGERADSKWKIRQNEIKLSKGERQNSIYDIIYEEKFKSTLNRNTRNSNKTSRTDGREISKTRWYNRRNESTRSNEMDRANEQLQVNSRRASNEGVNLQLNNYNPNIWQDTNDNPKFYDDETIDIIISNAPNIIKNRNVLEQYLRFNTDENRKENIIDVLGNAFTEYEVDNKRYGYKTYDNGLYLWKGDYLHRTEECFIEWSIITEYFVNKFLQQEVIDFAKEDLLSEEQQKETVAEADNASAFSFTQEMIDNVLIEGNHVENGKFRIYEFLTRGLSTKENEAFLKQEYGIGARSSDANGISEEHNSKGIKLYLGFKENKPKILLSWKQVEKRIKELIANNRYFNDLEKDEYNDWLDVNGISSNNINEKIIDEEYNLAERLHNYMLNYDIVSYHNNFSLDSTVEQNIELLKADISDESNIKEYIDFIKVSCEDLDYDDEIFIEAQNLIAQLEKRLPNYEFIIGDVVYIGIDEYEIRAIDNEKVTLADTKFPIMTKEMPREVFDNRVKDNSANDRLRTGNIRETTKNNIVRKDIVENNEFSYEKRKKELASFMGTQIKDNENSYKIVGFEQEIDIYDEKNMTNDIADSLDLFNLQNIKTEEYTIEPVGYVKYLIDKELSDLYESKDKEQIEIPSEPQEEKIKVNVKKKRRNKIEYFDLHPEISLKDRNNYSIENNDLGVGTPKEKFRRNIDAIKMLKQVTSENRYATPEEQGILSQYVGWGGLADVFDFRKDNWSDEYKELKSLLTEKEYKEAKESTLTAFYTPPIVINAIYKALENMGLERGNILEPSCRCW